MKYIEKVVLYVMKPTVLHKSLWAIKRIFFIFLYIFMVLSGGISMFVIAPITSYLLFRDFKFWKYARYFFPFAMAAYHQLALLIMDKSYRTMFSIPLIDPPMKQPDKSIIELSKFWDSAEHECTGCVGCCLKIGCPLLERESGRCRSYDSFFWNYFNCGRYPATQKQIDYYQCTKWIMRKKP
jgi:hypothetical protein